MSIPLARLTPAALLLVILAGCGPPTEDKVTARTYDEYGIWASTTQAHLPHEDARVFEQAQQEIKLSIMAHSSATGTEAIHQEYLTKVSGLTAHQLMVLGLEDRLQRLELEHGEAKKLYDANSKVPNPNAGTSRRVAEDKERADRADSQLTATRADLDRIKK